MLVQSPDNTLACFEAVLDSYILKWWPVLLFFFFPTPPNNITSCCELHDIVSDILYGHETKWNKQIRSSFQISFFYFVTNFLLTKKILYYNPVSIIIFFNKRITNYHISHRINWRWCHVTEEEMVYVIELSFLIKAGILLLFCLTDTECQWITYALMYASYNCE